MDWAQILVIILAVFLAIFLLLAIVLTVLLIKVTRQIKSITGTAMKTADGLEKAVAGLTKTTSPLIALRGIMKLFNKQKRK